MVLVWAPEVVVLLVRWVLVSSKCFNWFYVKIHVKALLVSDITHFYGTTFIDQFLTFMWQYTVPVCAYSIMYAAGAGVEIRDQGLAGTEIRDKGGARNK